MLGDLQCRAGAWHHSTRVVCAQCRACQQLPSPCTQSFLPEWGTDVGLGCHLVLLWPILPHSPALLWLESAWSQEPWVPAERCLFRRVSLSHWGQVLALGMHILSAFPGRLQIIKPKWIYGREGVVSDRQWSDFYANGLPFYMTKKKEKKKAQIPDRQQKKRMEKMHYVRVMAEFIQGPHHNNSLMSPKDGNIDLSLHLSVHNFQLKVEWASSLHVWALPQRITASKAGKTDVALLVLLQTNQPTTTLGRTA